MIRAVRRPRHKYYGWTIVWTLAVTETISELPTVMGTPLHAPGTYSDRQTTDLKRLVERRNHITHADLSLPQVLVLLTETTLVPRTSVFDLLRLPPGWGTRVVAERIQELNDAAGTQTPAWALILTDHPELE